MSRRSPTTTARIRLVLDERVALEAMILQRLAVLPAARKNAWLQSLLIKGFCQDCAETRAAQHATDAAPSYVPSETPSTTASVPDGTHREASDLREDTLAVDAPDDAPVALSALRTVVG